MLGTWTVVGTQIAVGFGLFYAVVKFFDTVGDRLNEDTRLEIAVWLLGRKKVSSTFKNYSDAFVKIFDRVFGTTHLSWKCFWRSAIAASFICGISILLSVVSARNPNWSVTFRSGIPLVIAAIWGYSVVVDYVSLLKARWLFGTKHTNSGIGWTTLLIVDVVIGFFLGVCALATSLTTFRLARDFIRFDSSLPITALLGEFGQWVGNFARQPTLALNWNARILLEARDGQITDFGFNFSTLTMYPPFFTSIWLWLYAGSGFLLKAARRFDIGFEWFNRHMDIEKKPLQSIGLVGGAIVACVYWAVVLVMKFAS